MAVEAEANAQFKFTAGTLRGSEAATARVVNLSNTDSLASTLRSVTSFLNLTEDRTYSCVQGRAKGITNNEYELSVKKVGEETVFTLSVKGSATAGDGAPAPTTLNMKKDGTMELNVAGTTYTVDGNGGIKLKLNESETPVTDVGRNMVVSEVVKISQALMGVRVDGMVGNETTGRQQLFNDACDTLNSADAAATPQEKGARIMELIKQLSMGTMVTTPGDFKLYKEGVETTTLVIESGNSFVLAPADPTVVSWQAAGNMLGAQRLLEMYADKVNTLPKEGTQTLGQITVTQLNDNGGFKIDVAQSAPAAATITAESVWGDIKTAIGTLAANPAQAKALVDFPATPKWEDILSALPEVKTGEADPHQELRAALNDLKTPAASTQEADLGVISSNKDVIAGLMVSSAQAAIVQEKNAKTAPIVGYLTGSTGVVSLSDDGLILRIDGTKTGNKSVALFLQPGWSFDAEAGTVSLGKIGIKLDNDGDISFEGAPAWDAATHVTDGIYLSSVTDKRSDNHIEYNEALVLKEEGNKYHLVAAEQRNTFSANKPFYDATAQGVELTLTDGKFEIKQESK